MSYEEKERHPNEAWSFTGTNAPGELVKKEKKNGTTYSYYRDKEGNLWYQTDRGRKFEEEMDIAKKRRRALKKERMQRSRLAEANK